MWRSSGIKRRIRLPVIGSVKLAHTLPDGIPYEAHISYRNGRWTLSLKYWREPTERPAPDSRIVVGTVDTGINPLATDSEGQVGENPKAYYLAERRLRRWQRAQARRQPDSRGCWEAQRRIDRLQRRTTGLRRNAQHQLTSTLVNKFRSLVIEDLNIKGMMAGLTPGWARSGGNSCIKVSGITVMWCLRTGTIHRARPVPPARS